MAKKMLIDATHPEETRVVVVDGQKVDDFDFESINKKQLAGNIYLAKVTRVEPSLQAAFVEYGGNRHGFLAFSEVHPDYYQIPVADREALLAEEKREEEAYARTQDEEDEKPQRQGRKRSRTRGRRRRDKDDQTGETAVAGLEVIDVEGGDAEAPSATGDTVAQAADDPLATVDLADGPDAIEGFEAPKPTDAAPDAEAPVEADASDEAIADAASDVDPAGHGDAAEPEVTKADTTSEDVAAADTPVAEEADPVTDPTPDTSAGPAPADAPVVTPEDATPPVAAEADVEETPSEDPGTPPTPKTMLESSGLDEDRVSEDPEARRRTTTSDEVEAEAAPVPADTDAEAPIPEQPTSDLKPDTETDTPAIEEVSASEPTAEVVPEPVSDSSESESQAAAEPSTETAGAEGAVAPSEDQEAIEVADSEAAQAETAPEEASTSRPSKRSRKGRTSAKTPDDADDQDAEDGDDEDEDDGVESVGADDMAEEVAASRARLRRRYKIQDVIKVRQIMLVQVVKEERGNKGAALTTYLSLAGRYCVLMPNTARGGGISRKITNASDRKRLREVVGELDVPTGMGLIVRTAGAERTRPEIKRDYEFLIRQWEQIRDLTLKSVAPCLIYEEGSLIKRSIRDLYSKDIDAILVEGEAGYREAKDYMKMLMPSHAKNVQQYGDQVPLFIRYQVETYLNGMFNPVVQLKSGGYIVIGITEALVAIDVNSGRSTKEGSIEDTALKTNLEAADEVARQLRLRDLAGLIVIDFIDMDENRNNRAVEKRMKDRLKTDRARIQVGRISAFGLMEMSRQRLRPGMLEATTQPCPHCSGMGLIRSDENLSLSILREVEEEAVRKRASEIVVTCPVDVANYLVNHKREHIAMIEARCQIAIQVMGDPALTSPNFKIDRMKTTTRTIAAAPVITAESGVQDDDDDTVEDAVVVTETTALSDETGGDGDGRSRRRRGRRGGSRRRRPDQNDGDGENEAADASVDAGEEGPADGAEDQGASRSGDDEEGGGRRRGRRRRGRGRRGRNENGDASESTEGATDAVAAAAAAETIAEEASDSSSAPAEDGGDETPQDAAIEPAASTDADSMPTEASVPETDAVSEDVPPTAATADEPEAIAEPAAAEPDPVEAESATADSLPAPEAEPETPAPDGAAEAVEPETVEEPTPELATANGDGAAEPAPAEDRPKRRGWWALGARNTD